MEHSNLVLFYFSPGRLKFTPPNLGQFQCDLCHPLIFKMRNGFIGFILLWVKRRFREGNAEGGKVLKKCHWCFPQFPLSGKSWGSRITHGEVRTFLFALGGQPCWSVLFFSFQCQPAEVRPCLICPCLVLVSEIHYGAAHRAGRCLSTAVQPLCFADVWHRVWWRWSHLTGLASLDSNLREGSRADILFCFHKWRRLRQTNPEFWHHSWVWISIQAGCKALLWNQPCSAAKFQHPGSHLAPSASLVVYLYFDSPSPYPIFLLAEMVALPWKFWGQMQLLKNIQE